MTRRAASIRNRLLVAAAATLLAWLFGWTSDEGLAMLLVAVVAAVLALTRAWFGGLGVLLSWLFRYRHVDIGLRQLGDMIGEHHDDMHRAGLVVPRGVRRSWIPARRRRRGSAVPRSLPDLVPRLRHRPYDGGVVISLEAVRAGMSQEDLLRAVPRLRSAWGVDVVRAEATPGGRLVEFTIPMTEVARRQLEEVDDVNEQIADHQPTSPSAEAERTPPVSPAVRLPAQGVPGRAAPVRPPDAPTVMVVQGGGSAAAVRARPPTIQPQLQPDERGRYELTMLPADAASSYSPESLEEPDEIDRNPSTDEIPVVQPPSRSSASMPPRLPPLTPGARVDGQRNPTDVDERGLRLGPHWRTGKER
jgi:hypothetical protein